MACAGNAKNRAETAKKKSGDPRSLMRGQRLPPAFGLRNPRFRENRL